MRYFLVLTLLIHLCILPVNAARAANNSASTWRFDHIVIVVNDITKATNDFIRLGFRVSPGNSANKKLYQNAYINFSDDTYIELYAPINQVELSEFKSLKDKNQLRTLTDNLNAYFARIVSQFNLGEGLADYFISDSKLDTNQLIIDLDNQGLSYIGPIPMRQSNTGKKMANWDVLIPESSRLPCLISDFTPKSSRTGPTNTMRHNNSVTGLASITIAVDDIDQAKDQYQELLGIRPLEKMPYQAPDNVKIVVYKVGSINIVLAQPLDKNGPLYQHLSTHGNSIYHITLYTTNKALEGMMDFSLTHKAKIKLIYK